MTKSNLGEKNLIHIIDVVCYPGGQELMQRPWRSAGLLFTLCSTFLTALRITTLEAAPPSVLVSPTSIIHQENKVNLVRLLSQLQSSKITLACIKMV